MQYLTTEVIAALVMLTALCIGFLVGWCMRPDDHTPDEDRKQIDALIRCAEQKNAKRIRLGQPTQNNFHGLRK